ncbi:hypothetical protein K491DRAFT_592509 [Lophiostoma macrostomum CBS 122681]|uniref:DUF2293 domain-containing protein n=1 Tax=Lophiostoma macrostomum CBS 122681 TaxID=1314788 RepID=A0A6A6TIM9_9PLEO|nr:hypothetical protein K491DRAFT_592509 [Lophiostoma macrostomum CBS 122681]
MTRIHHDRPTKGAFGASTLDRTRAAASRKKKGYKVMMEVVEQEKKKLRSVPTYTADAPPGYMFVPLGYHSDLTEYCKERCRKRNLPVHVVSAKPKGKAQTGPENESAPRIDTQRIGHHFPNEIIDEACDVLGYRYRNGVFQKSTRNYDNNQLSRKIQSIQYDQQRMVLHDRPNPAKSREQVQAAVLEVFPKIPDADLTAILDHAFEEGSKRVGNATELTLARRVQLAVGAYIRHQYTDYDKLLKSGVTWPDARQLAQPASYAKLKEWRDEAESNELEETFREIIVLDDDDDDDHSSSDGSSSASLDRDHSMDVEYISSQATARELQPEETAFLARPDPYAASRRSRRTIYLPLHRPSGPTSLVNPMDVYNARQANRVHVRPHPFTMSRQPQAQRRHDSRVSAAPYVADSSVVTYCH